MSLRGKAVTIMALSVVLATVTLVAGCSSNTSALFTKPELLAYKRLAVLGLDLEQEQIFMAAYVKTFVSQPVTFVERSQLDNILGEQDLLKDRSQERLDDKTRAKIRKIWGVEALVMCEYYKDEDLPASPYKLRVRIVDSETGAIIGSVVTEAYSQFESHARVAVEALRKDVLAGYRKGYSPPEALR